MNHYLDISTVRRTVEQLDSCLEALWPCQTAEMRALMHLIVHVRTRLLQMDENDRALRIE